MWYVVGGPFQPPPFPFPLFPLSQYVGTYPECSGISVERRNYLDGLTGRYRSAYPYTESSGGSLTCRTRTGVYHRWPRLRDVYRTVFLISLVPLQCEYYILHGLPSSCYAHVQYLYYSRVPVIQSGAVVASRSTPFIQLMLPSLY